MKIQTQTKAGGIGFNHNQTLVRTAREPFATVSVILLLALAIPGTANGELTEPLDGLASASAGPLHPDCLDHQQPRLCTRLVEEITEELGRFNEAFNPPDVDRLAAFYHEDAILFVGSTGRFFRGRDEIRDEFFAPLAAGIENAVVDLSAFRFQVISANLVILYGSPTTTVTFKDGSVVTLPPLPQTLTWVRQGGNPSNTFVVLTDHE